jgi:hypothetical protein
MSRCLIQNVFDSARLWEQPILEYRFSRFSSFPMIHSLILCVVTNCWWHHHCHIINTIEVPCLKSSRFSSTVTPMSHWKHLFCVSALRKLARHMSNISWKRMEERRKSPLVPYLDWKWKCSSHFTASALDIFSPLMRKRKCFSIYVGNLTSTFHTGSRLIIIFLLAVGAGVA